MSALRAQAQRVRRILAGLWRSAVARPAYWLAAGNTGSCVRSIIPGHAALGPKVCVFVFFDAEGIVRGHTLRYLDALVDEGFSIVFVSNARVHPGSLAHLVSRCARILVRDNRGYDFGAYRDGVLSLDLNSQSISTLLLANDSVYGPMSSLSDIFDRIDFAEADVWGVTDSWQVGYHLQSYLLAFGPEALANAGFADFWRGVRNVRSKWAVVRYYEIGLSRAMQLSGLRCAAVLDYEMLVRRARAILQANETAAKHSVEALRIVSAERVLRAAAQRCAMNPVIDMWLILADAGSPFVKRELLRDDPTSLPDLAAWHGIVRTRAPALYNEIIADLKRIMRRAAP